MYSLQEDVMVKKVYFSGFKKIKTIGNNFMKTTSPDSGDYKLIELILRKNALSLVNTVGEPLLVLDKNYKVIAANSNFYTEFQLSLDETENRDLFSLENNNWDIRDLRELLYPLVYEQDSHKTARITANFSGAGIETFELKASRLDFLEDEMLIMLIFNPVFDVEHFAQEEDHFLKSFQNILAHAPAMICIVRGPQYVFEVANEHYLQLVGNRDIIGKPVREALPEVENQGFLEMLDRVYTTGEPFVGNEVPIKIRLGEGKVKQSYLNFVYHPTKDSQGKVDGIFVHAVDVTEQVSARKKIEESEKELRKLIDAVPAIIWITNKEGHSTYLNLNWYNYTGQANKEAIGFGWLEAVHPEDRDLAESLFMSAIHEQKPFQCTFRLRNQKGNYRWVIDNGRPKFDIEGNYDGMIGTVVDVDEEKSKEQVIREKEHRIRSLVEEATVATALYTGREMAIEIANDAMVELWGKNRSVVGKTLREALPELEGQPFHRLLEEVYDTGKTYWGKEDKVDLVIDGKLQTGFYNFTYKPLRDEEGEIYGILNMAIDVTEMVRSKILLKESESHFRQMADLMPEKVTHTDANGNFIYFNQFWLDYTGRSIEELMAGNWKQIIHPEDKEEFEKNWEKSLTTGSSFEKELRLLSKNKNFKWHLCRFEAVKDETGEIKMWIGINTLIHKFKEEEKKKEDFLKMVSHELKTPVTSIKGYVQLLLALLKSDNDASVSALPLKPSLERIDHQIGRLTRLISEMLDLSRIEENKLELQMENFSINDLVIQTVQDINYTNTQHKIKINHFCDCKVYADKDRIGQVLINFITNAIKYSPESQEIDVDIKKVEGKKVAVKVRDRGIGIDEENHKKIFRRFYRVGVKSEETYSGFGIGLYLAKEIIHRHKGEITVKSQIGKGSEFSFILSEAKK